MLIDGLIVMVIGMGAVFSFLVIMVIAMNVTAKLMPLLAKFYPEEVPQQATVRVVEQNDEIAVVLAAVKALG